MTAWVNSDGLAVKFGLDQSKVADGGFSGCESDEKELTVEINGADVPTTDAPVNIVLAIPSGAQVTEAKLYVRTAFTSSTTNAALDIGLMLDDNDGTYSTYDDDGIDAAIARTALTAGAQIASDGAKIGTTITDATSGLPLVVSVGYQNGAFTAGEADLVIKYRLT